MLALTLFGLAGTRHGEHVHQFGRFLHQHATGALMLILGEKENSDFWVDGLKLWWGSVKDKMGRVKRLVIINSVVLLPGYRWHRTARGWRTRGLGELSNRIWSRRLLDWGLRESRGDWSRHDPAFVDMVWDHLDEGTFEAILRLYRSAPPERLAAAGERLGTIRAPALVIWGGKDRYLPARFGPAYAAALPDSELIEVPDAGHWPWTEDPSVIDRVIRFLGTDEDFRNS